jgi:hypothetical protein
MPPIYFSARICAHAETIGPRNASWGFSFEASAERNFVKKLHNVTVRPTGLFFSECLDPHYIPKANTEIYAFRNWQLALAVIWQIGPVLAAQQFGGSRI